MTISTREDSALVEEEKEEVFFESLDRILSSSSCSCSNSDEEPDSESNFGLDPMFSVPGFPLGVFRYDIWTSQPDSVSQRRSRLMREFGLANELKDKDKDKPETNNVGVDQLEGSVLCDQLTSSTLVNDSNVSTSGMCNLNSCDIDVDSSFVHRNSDDINCYNVVDDVKSSCTTNGFVIGNGAQKVDAVGKDADSNGSVPSVLTRWVEGDVSCNKSNGARLSETMCKIKNLDDGKEFVVNEIREDGTWKKLEEVGTGKQWTIEEFHFHMSVRHSPIVQEVMRRQNVEDGNKETTDDSANGSGGSGSKMKKRASWLRSIKNAASSVTGNYKERRSSDEHDTSSEKGARRSSSATDDSQDVSFNGPERVRVRQYGKSCKELSALYKSQEIQAHSGSIWTIKFSLDGKYLASAGKDRIIRIWQVELEKKGESFVEKPDEVMLNMSLMVTGSPDWSTSSPLLDGHTEKKRRGRSSMSRKSLSFDHIFVPETVFSLSEKPVCLFEGHLDEVLDLSWSKSQHLLSSSMDKTVRLWHLSSASCLKVFSHSDYVTCIQFNPVDDRYFISGSLDAKVRIWSIPERQVVDWSDLHEMVTAACYTPDGQGALVGSYKGSCRLYNTSENKLQEKNQINLQNKKKKSHHKKITGFQFVPGSTSEVLITSADSRIRVVDGVDLVHKFKGFRNTNSQISASITANGKYVVSASEDSYVYIWKHEADSNPSRSKTITVARSCELFHCQDVSVAIPWPGMVHTLEMENFSTGPTGSSGNIDEASTANHPPTPVDEAAVIEGSQSESGCSNSPLHGIISSATNSYFFDRFAATWPEEKLPLASRNRSPRVSVDFSNGLSENMSAWGMVIVTAGLHGEIRTFQNFGARVRT